MPNPADSTPDFNWIKRQLGDSAVLPEQSGESAVDETQPDATLDTSGSATQFISRESAEAPTSESNIHDVAPSDKSILDDDAPASDISKRLSAQSSDVILHDDTYENIHASDFAASDVESGEIAPVSADQQSDASARESDHSEATSESLASESTPSEVPAVAVEPEPPVVAEASISAFDLETPTPSAAFPMPITPRDPAQSRESRAVKPAGTPTATEQPPSHPSSTGRILLISYASAMTIVCLFLLLQLRREFRPHQLESLPDVKPLDERESQRIPIDAVLPRGHVLPLGVARRFGNILVEPLRVTYGPLEYVHYSGDASRVRPASDESVVKLWLRFTNVSDDQQIAPLDGRLVVQDVDYEGGRIWTKNFLRQSDREEIEIMYNLPPASEWELRGQDMGRVLQPGESFETYVATGYEHLPDVVGDVGADNRELVWRLHLRKGFGPAGHGVTTLVEVAFNGTDIQRES